MIYEMKNAIFIIIRTLSEIYDGVDREAKNYTVKKYLMPIILM